MYKARYKTVLRIHSPEEALLIDDNTSGADLYLAILDLYDALLCAAKGELPTNEDICDKVKNKFLNILCTRYEEFKGKIPGRLSPRRTPN